MNVTSKTGASMFGDGSQENDAIAPADTGPMSTSEAPSTGASPSRLKRKATAIHLEIITIDLMYDLTLTIGKPDHSTGGTAFQVNKGSIRNVSPVWSKMLGGGWKESNMSNISFPEDNCKAFLIVLQIAHFQFYQLPEKLSISELVDLAILTDKYELYNAVGIALEIKKWMEPYHRPGATWPANTMLQEFIITTSGFQMWKDAQYLSSRLAMEVQVNEAGDYYLEDDKRNKVPLRSDMLPSITQKIDCIRQEVLSAWIASCAVGFSETVGAISPPCGRTVCAATKIGVLLKALQTAGFYPSPPNTQALRRSVISYWRDLKDIGTKYKPYRPCKGTSEVRSYAWSDHRVSCSFEKCFGEFGLVNEVRATFQHYAPKDM